MKVYKANEIESLKPLIEKAKKIWEEASKVEFENLFSNTSNGVKNANT